MNYFLIFSALLISLLSCGNKTNTTATTTTTTPSTTDVVPQKPDYAQDWDKFKAAVLGKNKAGWQPYLKMSNVENLELSFESEDMKAILTKTSYTQLKDTDYNGTPVKEFAAIQTGKDEEGNETGSGYFYYFEQTPQGLKLIGFLAVG